MLESIVPARRKVQRMCFSLLLIRTMIASLSPLLHAQEIRIRALNGRNGRPISNECLNVWTGTSRGEHIVAATGENGIAVLHLTDTELQAEAGCPGWPTRARMEADGIILSGDRYVACQEYSKLTPGEPPTDPLRIMPSYPIKSILQSGVGSSNTCGKFRAEPKPGELVFYVRPRSFWERMRQ
jgi:hypothetical protein